MIDVGPSDEERARMKNRILDQLGITDPAVRHAAEAAAEAYADTVERLVSDTSVAPCRHADGWPVDVTPAEQPPGTLRVWSCCGLDTT